MGDAGRAVAESLVQLSLVSGGGVVKSAEPGIALLTIFSHSDSDISVALVGISDGFLTVRSSILVDQQAEQFALAHDGGYGGGILPVVHRLDAGLVELGEQHRHRLAVVLGGQGLQFFDAAANAAVRPSL